MGFDSYSVTRNGDETETIESRLTPIPFTIRGIREEVVTAPEVGEFIPLVYHIMSSVLVTIFMPGFHPENGLAIWDAINN